MKVRTSSGQEIVLTDKDLAGTGGEAKVFVKGSFAYKIYHDPKNVIPEGKLAEFKGVTSPLVIAPKIMLRDTNGVNIGYVMDRVDNAVPLGRVIPPGFRLAEGITDDQIYAMVLNARGTLVELHKSRILVVDLNEMNVCAVKGFDGKVYYIDVDSYQTPSYKATAIAPHIRDPNSPTFNEGTDWFSFAILAAQLMVGIHPYRGFHPAYTKGPNETPIEFLTRKMRARVSIFDPKTELPAACTPVTEIPSAYYAWLKAVLDDGKRVAPPDTLVGTAALPKKAIMTHQGGNKFDIKEVATATSPIINVEHSGPHLLFDTVDGIFFGNSKVLSRPGNPGVFGVRNEDSNPYFLHIFNNIVHYWDLKARWHLDSYLKADQIMSYNGNVYIRDDDKVIHITLPDSLLRAPILMAKQVASVGPNSSELWEGCLTQDIMGNMFVSLFPEPGKHYQLRVPELDGIKIIGAKFDKQVMMICGFNGSIYRRYTLVFDKMFSVYELTITDDVEPGVPNFIVLDNSVGLCYEDGKLEVFFAIIGNRTISKFDAPELKGDIHLTKRNGRACFFRGNVLYEFSMRK